jgi:PAS domain S-box-containing protein
LFDDSIDSIFITDWNGRILEANRQGAVLSGYTSRQLHSMRIDDLHAVNRNETGACADKLKAGETCSYESTLKSKTGRDTPIQVYVRRVTFEDTESVQWILRDISERKDLDGLREDLTSMIYHDLRSPLSNIVSSLDMLSSMFPGSENEAVQGVITIASHSTDRIQRLISSLLDINRLESGQKVGPQQAVPPAMLAKEAVDTIYPMIESRQQILTNVIPQKMRAAWVDTDMIRRVLINILENASKFTPPEGKIELGAKEEGNWIKFWVADNGPGIPLADQDRIFDKFARFKGEQGPGGLGIGLAFCRLAIQGHGGKIWVESKPGQGAKFFLLLPITPSA